jgi:hypothetical protein
MSSHLRYNAARVILALFALGLVMYAFPFQLPAGMDFSHLYLSARSIMSGGSIYGLGISQASTDPSSMGLMGALPYPGPPWSLPLLLGLGLLPPTIAATAWGLVSVLCICASLCLVLPGTSERVKAALIVLALLSAPVQGHLIIGQMTAIALLGAALVIAGQRGSSAVMVGMGLFLLTCRPHLGGPVVVVVALGLVGCGSPLSRKALVTFVALLSLFTVIALCLDPTCLSGYVKYLNDLNSLPSNRVCDTCSSLPVIFSGRSPDGATSIWTERFLWSAGCYAVLGLLLARLGSQFHLLVGGALCATLIAAPYNRNYDFVLLIIPLLLAGREGWSMRGTDRRASAFALLCVGIGLAIGGILPYLIQRSLQGELLVYGAAAGFLAVLVVIQGHKETDCSKVLVG